MYLYIKLSIYFGFPNPHFCFGSYIQGGKNVKVLFLFFMTVPGDDVS